MVKGEVWEKRSFLEPELEPKVPWKKKGNKLACAALAFACLSSGTRLQSLPTAGRLAS